MMSAAQKAELNAVFGNMKGCNNLDYVTCWYKKASDYMQETDIEAAFVSTNSITQGQQVPLLWRNLFNSGVKINFAHQTFKWSNESARGQGMAAVYCVIIGFSLFDRAEKRLYSYADITGDPISAQVKQINSYLLDAPQVFIEARSAPLCNVPEMVFGSMPNDGGGLILTADDKAEFERKEPDVMPFVRPYMGADEFINNIHRYCLWFKGGAPSTFRKNSLVRERLQKVKEHREVSKRETTKRLANTPTVFGEIRQPETDYLLVPSTTGGNRQYIPIGFIDKDTICSNANLLVPNATLYEFGVMESAMHMTWTKTICGYLGTSYRYSATVVYNNFVWPAPTDKQREAIEEAGQGVLDARARYPDESLADLYDPLTMPPDLAKAHERLDRAVDRAYNRDFANDGERVAWLFELYQQKAGELFAETQKKGKGRKRRN
jgi:hypothetical protein